MKNFKSLLTVALVAFAMVSCTKLDKVLPKADGVWKVTSEVYVAYENGVETEREVTAAADFGTYTFKDDETGTYSAAGQADEAFTWTTNSDGDKLILTMTAFPIAVTIDVLELKSKSQTWFFAFEDGTDREETTIMLERE